jgi:hypothetical protein
MLALSGNARWKDSIFILKPVVRLTSRQIFSTTACCKEGMYSIAVSIHKRIIGMMTAMPIALKILYVLPLFFIRWVQKIVSATNKQSLLCFYFLFCLFCIEIFLKGNTKI